MQGEVSTRLGFTDYFRVELAWAKLLGAVLLHAPVPARLKGMGIRCLRHYPRLSDRFCDGLPFHRQECMA